MSNNDKPYVNWGGYMNDKWGWYGPVGLPRGTEVDVIFRDGSVSEGREVHLLDWAHDDLVMDIVRWRPRNPLPWITWAGGVLQVPPEFQVEIERRDGITAKGPVKSFDWSRGTPLMPSDIVRYRLVTLDTGTGPEPQQEPEPKPKACPHAELMAEYAKDALVHAEPWTLWQFRANNGRSSWLPFDHGHPSWEAAYEYRRKPPAIPTRVINGFTVPAPLKEEPEHRQWYYLASLAHPDFSVEVMWHGGEDDKMRLDRGLLFREAKHAVANAMAMCGFDPQWSQE